MEVPQGAHDMRLGDHRCRHEGQATLDQGHPADSIEVKSTENVGCNIGYKVDVGGGNGLM